MILKNGESEKDILSKPDVNPKYNGLAVIFAKRRVGNYKNAFNSSCSDTKGEKSKMIQDIFYR